MWSYMAAKAGRACTILIRFSTQRPAVLSLIASQIARYTTASRVVSPDGGKRMV